MLLKRFRAESLSAALAKVRAECGEDALLFETRPTRDGFLVVAAAADQAAPPPQALPAEPPRRWTRGFAPLASCAEEFGIGPRVLRAVEKALLGTRVQLGRAGDPALPGLAMRVLEGLIRADDRVEGPLAEDSFRAMALVGPTGVGKTTTLAKLAARAISQFDQDVAIVTIDTFRVAAVEQLRAYAEIMEVPFEVAFTPADLRRALHRFRDRDRVFVDTTGRSPFDLEALSSLKGLLAAGRGLATLLCLPAASRRRDAIAVLDAYDRLGLDSVVLTKWDETDAPGESLSVLIERGVPLCHVTTGQEVPDDIRSACPTALAAAAFDRSAAQEVGA